MALTRSWEERRPGFAPASSTSKTPREPGVLWLAGASLLVACGLAFVYIAKTQNFPDVSERLRHGDMLDLNSVSASDQLLPYLDIFQDGGGGGGGAGKAFAFLGPPGPLRNLGTLSRLRQQRKPLLPI